MSNARQQFDIIVIGGGHAGCEAVLASARMGANTALVTMDMNALARMSCNPAIGGLGKGHLVREIDALGGEMGKVIDATGIQFRMLNRSKGPAVWSPRAQADRELYAAEMTRRVQAQSGLTLVAAMAIELLVTGTCVNGIRLEDGSVIEASCVIITTGTFLNARMFTGLEGKEGGRHGEAPAIGMTQSLQNLGIQSGRFKTGTPPRIHKDSVHWKNLERQDGDAVPSPFSFQTDAIDRPQVPCHITYTNLQTHEILQTGFNESPMFRGVIEGIGPRYCPSVEDKVARFPDKTRHQIFLEPEGLDSDLIYVNGFSTSLPGPIQEQALRTIEGLESAVFVRHGYAVEYDYFPPNQLRATMESRCIDGLFLAGQVNGTSGYEEAAAQGLMAGINAVARLRGEEPLILTRSEAYIGVMMDDLVLKELDEPYRMFTSRAEYRLLLRQDNADARLMRYGHALGLIPSDVCAAMEHQQALNDAAVEYLEQIRLSAESVNPVLSRQSSTLCSEHVSPAQLLRRPEIRMQHLRTLLKDDPQWQPYQSVPDNLLEMTIKYAGYIQRQQREIEKHRRLEVKRIPGDFHYAGIPALRAEARERFSSVRPVTVGQAGRIPGITPADIGVLLVYLKRATAVTPDGSLSHQSLLPQDVSRETTI